MKFLVEIDCGNAAFDGEDLHGEVARLLRAAAKGVEAGFGNLPMFDINGNDVGRAYFIDAKSSAN